MTAMMMTAEQIRVARENSATAKQARQEFAVEKYLQKNGEKLQEELIRYGTASRSFQILGDHPELSEAGIDILVGKLEALGFTVTRKSGTREETYGVGWRYVTLTISV